MQRESFARAKVFGPDDYGQFDVRERNHDGRIVAIHGPFRSREEAGTICASACRMPDTGPVADLQRVLGMSADELAADAPARSFVDGFCAAARGE